MRRAMAVGCGGLLAVWAVGLVGGRLSSGDPPAVVVPPPPAPPIRGPLDSAVPSPVRSAEGDAFAVCAEACPAGTPASCHVDCGLALVEAHPADERAWFVARMGAMAAGDEAAYRAMLAAGPRPYTAGVRWGRWVAATMPQTQELLLRQVADAGWQGTMVARALGADACGVAGPTFVVCVP